MSTSVSISLLDCPGVRAAFIAPGLLLIGDPFEGTTIHATPEQFLVLAHIITEGVKEQQVDSSGQQISLRAEQQLIALKGGEGR
ncbi:hypothetical protein DUZ99_02255 [Xylanibacillus composti]|uniref:Uncharacterized protein n=1 Tax=Xylanibacillus composti TaxID=1572762 RepID=A0A8J4H0Z7_9BACL|nr:hypothetical protein [Xylanibacillus composti]MDT9723818.1 hypothetical protein [Xylanibacillus composti]GIQ67406.1 hypothetical protein XYCOK13_02300 [Xylanibacillus composti]